MSGVILVSIIALLIFMIGLGFAFLTVHKEVAELSGSVEEMKYQCECLSKDIGQCADAIEGCYIEEKQAVNDLGSEVLALRKEVYGTADEREFKRLQTQAFVTLPGRIETLENRTEHDRIKTRIEEQDGFVGKVMVLEETERREKPDA